MIRRVQLHTSGRSNHAMAHLAVSVVCQWPYNAVCACSYCDLLLPDAGSILIAYHQAMSSC